MFFSIAYCFSQDVITKRTGEDILAKISEVNQTEVKYRKFDNPTGPLFTISKAELLMIRYENGTKDVFSETYLPLPTPAEMSMMGMQDARLNYRGRRSGAGWTAATTVVFSPVLGLIPAIAISSTEPADRNLNYRDHELMGDYNYHTAYREEAHKIKKRKVWTGFGIGSGAWLLLVLLL